MSSNSPRTVALLPWGDTWEDFFSTIDVSIDTFRDELTGGWQFAFIDALKLFGINTVVIYPTMKVTKPLHFQHKHSGALICMVPVPWFYRLIRKRMVHPYPSLAYWWKLEDLFGNVHRYWRWFFHALKHVAPYLSLSFRSLVRELKRHEVDAIFCQEYEYTRFDLSILAGKWLGLPVFTTFQGGTYDWNWIGRFIRPRTMRRCKGFAIGPRAEIERVKKSYQIPDSRLAQIYNPVDSQMWASPVTRNEARSKFGLSPDLEIVLWHGRVDIHNKGLDILLDSWERVCQERPERKLFLFLLGSAEDSKELHERINALTVKNVKWLDQYVNDRNLMRWFLATGDIFAFPSRWEGFPVSPLEAMACGLPVVAADAAGVADIFESGEESGGVVVPRDDPESFAREIGRLLDDPVLRMRLGERAQSRIQSSFTLDIIGKKLYDLFSNN